MVYQMTVCCLLVLGFGWLLWRLSGALLTPVCPGEDTALTVVVTAKDAAPELEAMLRGLIWLHDSGTIRTDILVLDKGLTPEASAMAQKLAQQRSFIRICKSEELCRWMQTQTRSN